MIDENTKHLRVIRSNTTIIGLIMMLGFLVQMASCAGNFIEAGANSGYAQPVDD